MRWSRASLFAGVVVLGLGSLWLGLGGHGSGDHPVPLAAPEAARAERDAAAVADLHEPAAGNERVGREAGVSGREPHRVRPALSANRTEGRHGAGSLELLLVEAGSERPVPGARVWVLEERSSWDFLDVEDYVAGESFIEADAGGRARLSLEAWEGAARRLVVAAAPGWIGGRHVDAPSAAEGPLFLELLADGDVAVEVRDAGGRPAAGVPLALVMDVTGGEVYSSEQTDDTGAAIFRHVGAARTAARGGRLSVGVDLLLRPARVAWLESLPPEPLRFSLPPLGAVEVVVLDERGEPVPDGTFVEMGMVRRGEPRELPAFSLVERETLPGATEAGRVAFEGVELDAEVELLVRTPDRSDAHAEYFPGPSREGERVRHTAVLVPRRPLLELRALDEAGSPLADAELKLSLRVRRSSLSSESRSEVRTDGQGRFRVDLKPPHEESQSRVLTVSTGDGSLTATLDLSHPFPPELVRLGDLRLAPAPLVVAGRVLDVGGEAVAGARVAIELGRTDEQGRFRPTREERRAVTKRDGSFACHGEPKESEMRLQAILGTARSAFAVLPRGARDVELRLLVTGSLAGSLKLEPGVRGSDLIVRLVPSGPGTVPPDRSYSDFDHPGVVDLDGSFHVEGLLPGRYGFWLHARGLELLGHVPEVEITAGEECRDPRLAPLDLRGALFGRRLTLVLPGGEFSSARLTLGPSGGGTLRDEFWSYENPVVVLTLHSSFDGLLRVPGYQSVALEAVSEDREVPLRAGLPVCLVLPSDVTLPRPPLYLKVGLASGGHYRDVNWSTPPFDETREVRDRAYGPGRWRVVWILVERVQGTSRSQILDVDPPHFIEVLDTQIEQRIELEVDPLELHRALVAIR